LNRSRVRELVLMHTHSLHRRTSFHSLRLLIPDGSRSARPWLEERARRWGGPAPGIRRPSRTAARRASSGREDVHQAIFETTAMISARSCPNRLDDRQTPIAPTTRLSTSSTGVATQ